MRARRCASCNSVRNSQPTMSYPSTFTPIDSNFGYWRQMCTETDRPVGGEFIVYPGVHKQEACIRLCRDIKPLPPVVRPAPQAQRERAAAAGAAHNCRRRDGAAAALAAAALVAAALAHRLHAAAPRGG